MKNIKNPLFVGKNTSNIDLKKKKSFGYSSLGFGSGGLVKKFISASGGDSVITDGNFKIHVFTNGGTFTVNEVGNLQGSTTVDYLVVAGGGGSGRYFGGGAGGGGVRDSFPNPATGGHPVSVQGYPISVGGGGNAPGGNTAGNNGGSSQFSSFNGSGGGAGGGRDSNAGRPGGSGGGGGPGGSAGSGNSGGHSPSEGNPGGGGGGNQGRGGGGAANAGSNALHGPGGNGRSVTIAPNYPGGTTFAGGGGGSGYGIGSGGSGGGGHGAQDNSNSQAGTNGLGGGATSGAATVSLDTGSAHFTRGLLKEIQPGLSITGSLKSLYDGTNDPFSIISASITNFRIDHKGIVYLRSQSSSPSATEGGLYLDTNFDLYIGQ